jgi:uncharacterized protein (TIGR02246 family)
VTLDELIARESIRDLVARYNANGDSGRFDQVVELFAPDAVMEVNGVVHRGREAIRSIFTTTASSLRGFTDMPVLRHTTSTLQIDLTGPMTARSRCYHVVLLPHGVDHWGRYLDEYGLIGDRWLFTHRKVVNDGYVPGGFRDARENLSDPGPSRSS